MNANAERGQAQSSAVPMPAGVEERDKRGQHAVADAAQRQPHAVRSHAPQHVAEWQVLARFTGTGSLRAAIARLMPQISDGQQANGCEAPG